jgi:hypothetical protein
VQPEALDELFEDLALLARCEAIPRRWGRQTETGIVQRNAPERAAKATNEIAPLKGPTGVAM